MRVAMVVSGFPLVSETFILRQISGIIDLGHEVDVLAGYRPPAGQPVHPQFIEYGLAGRTTYVEAPPDADYWELPALPVFGETWLPGEATAIPNWKRLLRAGPTMLRCALRSPRLTFRVLSQAEYGYQARSLSALYRLRAASRQRGPYDIVHAHFGPVANSFRFAGELWHAPFLVTFHGYDFCVVPRKEGKGVYRQLFDVADAVTINCRYAGDRVENLGCPRSKIHTLHMGASLEEFPFAPRPRKLGEPARLLTVCRLVEKKGVEYALRAVSQTLRTPRAPGRGPGAPPPPPLRYDIVGDGPLRATLEALAAEFRLQDVVTFHGARDGQQVGRMMRESHLFLLPSVTAGDGDQEGTPVSLMEAQATGLPVLSTLHSGIPEVVLDGRTGFLVPERDVDGLADRLGLLIGRPDLCAEMGRAGREHVEAHYDARKLSRQLVSLYEQVRSHRRRSRGGIIGGPADKGTAVGGER